MSKLKVAAVADLQCEGGPIGLLYRPLCGKSPGAADVLVIGGDLTDLGKPAEASFSPPS